jgi:protein gp37
MAAKTSIEWTDASWTPIRAGRYKGDEASSWVNGWHCEIITPGCERCYAEARNKWVGTGLPYLRRARETAMIYLEEKMLTQPLRWKRPRRIFVCSMSDLFGDWVPDAWIDRMMAVMALCPQHIFQVLTKRAERMRDYLAAGPRARIYDQAEKISEAMTGHHSIGTGVWPLSNMWAGVSVEDQRRADERIPLLLDTPAAVRWISAEPLLGPIDLGNLRENTFDAITGCGDRERLEVWDPTPSLDWVVAGSESGPGARPCDLNWVRNIRDQCSAAGVAFFWKQDAKNGRKISTPELDGRRWLEYPAQERA